MRMREQVSPDHGDVGGDNDRVPMTLPANILSHSHMRRRPTQHLQPPWQRRPQEAPVPTTTASIRHAARHCAVWPAQQHRVPSCSTRHISLPHPTQSQRARLRPEDDSASFAKTLKNTTRATHPSQHLHPTCIPQGGLSFLAFRI